MATAATFGSNRNVFKHERTLFVGVALVADRIATGQRLHLAQGGSPVDVVAIGALDHFLVYAMVVGLRKVRLRGYVTAIAKIRLSFGQQMLRFLSLVRGVAVQATNIVTGVHRTGEMALFEVFAMTAQTAFV